MTARPRLKEMKMPPHEKASTCNLETNKNAVASNEAIAADLPDEKIPTNALITKLRQSAFSKMLQAINSRENVRVTMDPITGARKVVVEKTNEIELISLATHLGIFPTINGNMINRYDAATSTERTQALRAKLDKFLADMGHRLLDTSNLPISKE
jgi:hypothetical protein